RAEQAVPAALADVEVHRPHRGDGAITLGQSPGDDHDAVTRSIRSVAACSRSWVLTGPASRKVKNHPGGRTTTALISGALISAAAPAAMGSRVPPAEPTSGTRSRPADPRTASTTNVVSPPP